MTPTSILLCRTGTNTTKPKLFRIHYHVARDYLAARRFLANLWVWNSNFCYVRQQKWHNISKWRNNTVHRCGEKVLQTQTLCHAFTVMCTLWIYIYMKTWNEFWIVTSVTCDWEDNVHCPDMEYLARLSLCRTDDRTSNLLATAC